MFKPLSAFSSLVTKILLILLAVGFIFLTWKLAQTKSDFYIKKDRTAIITDIKELQRLETSSFTIEKIIEAGTQGNAFKELLFGDKLLLIAHGQVIAGVDLSKLNENDIIIQEKSVTLTLPESEIFFTRIDERQTTVYDRSKGLLTKGSTNLETEARQAAEVSIKQAACEADILNDAAKNAERQMTAFLKALGFETVTVSIKAGSC